MERELEIAFELAAISDRKSKLETSLNNDCQKFLGRNSYNAIRASQEVITNISDSVNAIRYYEQRIASLLEERKNIASKEEEPVLEKQEKEGKNED